MERILTAAKAQYGALQAKIINSLTGNTSYTKKDMKDAMDNNHDEFEKSVSAINEIKTK